MIKKNKKEPHRNKPVEYKGRKGVQEYKGGTLYGHIYDDLYQGGKLYKNSGNSLEEAIKNYCGEETDNNYSAKVAAVTRGYKEFSNKNLLLEKKFSDIIENIKEKISSQIPTKEIIALDLSKRILENLPKKEKENFREDIEYKDRLLRNDKIIFQKPEIKYREKNLDLLSNSVLNRDQELNED